MATPSAYDGFIDSISMAESLLDIEKLRCANPPKQAEQVMAIALRGGAAVLMVASFENFLRECFESNLALLTSHPHRTPFSQLPDEMRVHNIYATLERAMKGQPFQKAPPRKDRLIDIESACKAIVGGNINPDAFAETGGNPDSARVKSAFENAGIRDIFSKIHGPFLKKWGAVGIAATFIPDTLDTIVRRRHVVAHNADALNLSRSDLRAAVRFLKILARVLDDYLYGHVKVLMK